MDQSPTLGDMSKPGAFTRVLWLGWAGLGWGWAGAGLGLGLG